MLLHKSVSAVKHRRSRLGIVTRKIKQKKWSPAEDQLLGSAPDSEIARRLGCHKFVVQARRLRLKIIAHRRSWKAKADGLLGQLPDAERDTVADGGVPPIRYDALVECLKQLGFQAHQWQASIHMPSIGCGLTGGKWEKIEPLIKDTLPGTRVFVYDLPVN